MGFTQIKLDKMRNLRYGMKAISLVEKKFKKPINKIDMDSLTMEEAAVLIWAGLTHEDKNITPDKVMDLVDDYSNVPEVMRLMTEAMNESFGIGAAEEEAGKNE